MGRQASQVWVRPLVRWDVQAEGWASEPVGKGTGRGQPGTHLAGPTAQRHSGVWHRAPGPILGGAWRRESRELTSAFPLTPASLGAGHRMHWFFPAQPSHRSGVLETTLYANPSTHSFPIHTHRFDSRPHSSVMNIELVTHTGTHVADRDWASTVCQAP